MSCKESASACADLFHVGGDCGPPAVCVQTVRPQQASACADYFLFELEFVHSVIYMLLQCHSGSVEIIDEVPVQNHIAKLDPKISIVGCALIEPSCARDCDMQNWTSNVWHRNCHCISGSMRIERHNNAGRTQNCHRGSVTGEPFPNIGVGIVICAFRLAPPFLMVIAPILNGCTHSCSDGHGPRWVFGILCHIIIQIS